MAAVVACDEVRAVEVSDVEAGWLSVHYLPATKHAGDDALLQEGISEHAHEGALLVVGRPSVTALDVLVVVGR